MARVVIEFDWVRDPKGYRLAEVGRPKMLCVVRNGAGHGPKDLLPSRPLERTNQLFKIFANAATPERVLDFVQNFGPLTWDGRDPKKGEPVHYATRDADHMQQVLRYWESNHTKSSMPFVPQTGRIVSLDARLVGDPVTKSPKWELRPQTLLDALWMQLGEALTAGALMRRCEHCGDWFELGHGSGRRQDAKFCSDEHRIAFNSLKRSREK
jgi:hypothetical protein